MRKQEAFVIGLLICSIYVFTSATLAVSRHINGLTIEELGVESSPQALKFITANHKSKHCLMLFQGSKLLYTYCRVVHNA